MKRHITLQNLKHLIYLGAFLIYNIMEKICYQYYNHSPRMHVNIIQEVFTVPVVGDIITVWKDEFFSLNKKIKDKNYFIRFKVVSRETRAVYKKNILQQLED